ncbi:phage tail assembly chaperone [Rhizobium sp. 32-5/1]
MTGSRAFPWADVLHLGLCLLRLSPTNFWAMTPREFLWPAAG